jgi:hypothetical protein
VYLYHARSTSNGDNRSLDVVAEVSSLPVRLERGFIHILLMEHELIWVSVAPVDKEAYTPGLGSSRCSVLR